MLIGVREGEREGRVGWVGGKGWGMVGAAEGRF